MNPPAETCYISKVKLKKPLQAESLEARSRELMCVLHGEVFGLKLVLHHMNPSEVWFRAPNGNLLVVRQVA